MALPVRVLRTSYFVLCTSYLTLGVFAAPAAQNTGTAHAFVGAALPGVGASPAIDSGVIVVRDGKIEAIGRSNDIKPPAGARVTDLKGKFVLPGLISAHAHVSAVDGLRPPAYTAENTARQLALFARYGITTVWSLGGEQAPAFAARDAQAVPTLDRARIYVAGEVVAAKTPDEARQVVARVAATKPDVIKIRVDDNLGTTEKMTPDVYRAVIDEAHRRGLRVAAHIFYLDDAKGLLKAGADAIVHSVRDKDIDAEFIAMMKDRGVPYCPTLTREVSTFAYESVPPFFSDPFFLREADTAVVGQLREPARQTAMRTSMSAQRYKAGLEVAKRNLKRAADGGVTVIMGTDAGPSPERFIGYFEHLEMEMMVQSGLTAAQVLRSATVDAARAMKVDAGVLAKGAWADFVVFDRNPLQDIRNTHSIASVWIAGNQVRR